VKKIIGGAQNNTSINKKPVLFLFRVAIQILLTDMWQLCFMFNLLVYIFEWIP